jgi:DNA-directed RNA polymerase specialized sigma24 family protein
MYLRQFCHGDLDAFESLFRRHQSDVYGWIVRIVRDPDAAEDLTVETFWRIYRTHAPFTFGPKSSGRAASLPDLISNYGAATCGKQYRHFLDKGPR